MRRHEGASHRKKNRRGWRRTAALVAATALALSGCGGNDDETTAAPANSPMQSASPVQSTIVSASATSGTITLTAPGDGTTVDRSFTVQGAGSAFEGTLLWTLTDSAGAPSASGYTTAGSTTPKPFQFTVEAPAAGSYTLTVYREAATDGARTDAVSRDITVR